MTAPSPEPLWVTDEELIKRLGVPVTVARPVLAEYDAKPHFGFPQKQKLWGGRRYWPAVKAYFDRQAGLIPQDARRTA